MTPVLDKLGRQIMVGQIIAYATSTGGMGIYRVGKINQKPDNQNWPTLSAYEYTQREYGKGPFYQASERTVCLKFPRFGVILPDGYADIRNEMA